MVSYNEVQYKPCIKLNGEYGNRTWFKGVCLSTDTKPAEDIINGSYLLEMDTSKKFYFDEENGEWLEQIGSSNSDSSSSAVVGSAVVGSAIVA